METIKRSRRRLAISLLTIIAMVFTLIPCMGADVAEADTNDLVKTNTPTQSCPVSKVEYVPQSDGQFNLKVTVDLDVFQKAGYLDGDYYWYDISIINNGTGKYLAYEEGNLVSLSGERIYEYNKEKNPNYSLTQNQGITIKYSLLDANPQGDPETGEEPDPINSPVKFQCTAPSLFTGFEAVYKVSGGDESVDLSYDKYYGYGNDTYMDNVFLRETPSTGTIRIIDTIGRTHYANDYQVKSATNYIYYVVKKDVLNEVIPELLKKLDYNEVAFSAEEKAKLRTISAYKEVTIPAPRIVKVSNLKASPGVRSASLTWKYEYDTTAPNVTGFNVNIYAPNGSLYKTYKYKYTPQYSSYCGATYSIPYDGTYYFTVTPYYVYNGKTYTGTTSAKVSCTSSKISAATGSVTKISSKKARITIKKSAGSTGTMVYQYVSGKWKYIGKTTGSSYTVTKNTAGKKKYRLRSYIVDNGKTYYSGSYSGTYSPKSNTAAFKYSSRPAAYPMYSHYWRPDKIYYSGNKVVVKGKFINTHIYNLDYFKIKLTVKCQGKVIGTKTINSGKMKSNKVKKVTVKLDKSKAGYDLRAGNLTWSYKIIKWR